MLQVVKGQLSLVTLGPDAADPFRFTWHNTREGVAVWVEYRRSWRPGIVVHRGRKYVNVALTDRARRTVYVKRSYPELRRRVVKPRLTVLAKA